LSSRRGSKRKGLEASRLVEYLAPSGGRMHPAKCLNRTNIINIIMLTHFEGPAGLFFMSIRLDLNRPKNRFGRGYRSINRPLLGSAQGEPKGRCLVESTSNAGRTCRQWQYSKSSVGLGRGLAIMEREEQLQVKNFISDLWFQNPEFAQRWGGDWNRTSGGSGIQLDTIARAFRPSTSFHAQGPWCGSDPKMIQTEELLEIPDRLLFQYWGRQDLLGAGSEGVSWSWFTANISRLNRFTFSMTSIFVKDYR